MIFSSLDVDYTKMGFPKALVRALDYLKKTDLKALAAGSYQLEGDKMYVNIDCVDTRTWHDTKAESHKQYIDVQFMIDGEENQAFFVNHGDVEPVEFYPERDLYFYSNETDDEGEIQLTPGNYTVFFPCDVHRPLIAVNEPRPIKKAVVKIHVDLLAE